MEEIVHLIPLTRGRHAIVDMEDWEELRQLKWGAAWNCGTKSFYAEHSFRRDGKTRKLQMGRVILGLNEGDPLECDHVNRDTLDNRRSNLRIVTSRQNNENRRKHSPYGYGVTRDTRSALRRPFQAVVHHQGKNRHLGMFATPEEAREARRLFLEEHDA